jgi:hypothetical protein
MSQSAARIEPDASPTGTLRSFRPHPASAAKGAPRTTGRPLWHGRYPLPVRPSGWTVHRKRLATSTCGNFSRFICLENPGNISSGGVEYGSSQLIPVIVRRNNTILEVSEYFSVSLLTYAFFHLVQFPLLSNPEREGIANGRKEVIFTSIHCCNWFRRA